MYKHLPIPRKPLPWLSIQGRQEVIGAESIKGLHTTRLIISIVQELLCKQFQVLHKLAVMKQVFLILIHVFAIEAIITIAYSSEVIFVTGSSKVIFVGKVNIVSYSTMRIVKFENCESTSYIHVEDIWNMMTQSGLDRLSVTNPTQWQLFSNEHLHDTSGDLIRHTSHHLKQLARFTLRSRQSQEDWVQSQDRGLHITIEHPHDTSGDPIRHTSHHSKQLARFTVRSRRSQGRAIHLVMGHLHDLKGESISHYLSNHLEQLTRLTMGSKQNQGNMLPMYI